MGLVEDYFTKKRSSSNIQLKDFNTLACRFLSLEHFYHDLMHASFTK